MPHFLTAGMRLALLGFQQPAQVPCATLPASPEVLRPYFFSTQKHVSLLPCRHQAIPTGSFAKCKNHCLVGSLQNAPCLLQVRPSISKTHRCFSTALTLRVVYFSVFFLSRSGIKVLAVFVKKKQHQKTANNLSCVVLCRMQTCSHCTRSSTCGTHCCWATPPSPSASAWPYCSS